jgi:PAS domain S-box-containing protein
MDPGRHAPDDAGPPRPDPVGPSAREIDLLLWACGHRGPLASRNRALVAVLARCGLRVGETLALDLADVRAREGELIVREGAAPRAVTLPPACAEALEDWTARRRGLPGCEGEGLFVTRDGTRLAPSYVRQMLSRLARRAGLPATVGPESLRRAHAAELVRRGWPLPEIQRRLGYSTPAAARRFLRAASLSAPAQGPAASSGASVDALLRGSSPCRTCLHGDALEAGPGSVLLDDASEAVLTADRTGTIRSANRAAAIFFGAGTAGLVGTSVWELLADPRHARLEQACRECLATGRPSWAVDASSPSGETRTLARVIPSREGVTIWVRDDLALGGLTGLARQLSAFAHGGAPGGVLILRAVREGAHRIVDFVVAAAYGTRETLVIASPEEAIQRRLSELLRAELSDGVRAQLEDVTTTGRPRRVRMGVGRGAAPTTIHCWMVRLAGDWVAVAVKAPDGAPGAPSR